MTGDRGLVALPWLVKLTAALAVLGIFGFDGVALIAGRVGAQDDAQDAARAASQSFQANHDIDAAYQASQQALASSGDRVLTTGFSIDADGTAHLLVRRDVHTLVIGRIGDLHHYTVQTVHGDANADPS